ncbi:MAG: proton-conducting transporter membrane subunit [bacterium]|nr:proton-conducting transporter membrane subunit [bacterium]
MNLLLPLPIVLPLLTGIILFLLRRHSAWQERLSLLSLGINLIVALSFLSETADGTIFTHRMGLWPFPYGILLGADRLTATMLCLAATVVGASAYFSKSYLSEGQRQEVYHPLLHFLLMGIQGAFVTADIFNLFVFFEVMLISAYSLLGFYHNLDQLEMALKYTCLNLIASALFLLGVSLLYAQVGTVNMADLSVKVAALGPTPLMILTAAIFLLVFSTKAAIFPMQLWLPSAHSISPTPISAILAGVLVKVGLYAIIRCATLIFPAPFGQMQGVLVAFALATIILGAIGTLPQKNLKRILAYSTINQLGYIAFGVALLSPAGMAAAVFYMVSHGFLKSSLLLGAGLNQKLTGTVDLDEMGGMMVKAPFASVLLLVGFLSLAGIPPLNGFFSKFFLIQAGYSQGMYTATSIALGMGVISLLYNFSTYQQFAWGSGGGEVKSAPAAMYIPVAFLAAFAVIFGLGVGWLYDWSLLVAKQISNPALYIAAMQSAP